ncbi:MAG: hypothetical protein ABI806_14985 [Candidatus Solibacter sp.]
MKPATLLILAALATHAAAVPLCLSKRTMTDNFAILRAQVIVAKLFIDAGVRVEWLSVKQCESAPTGAIFLLLEADGPKNFKPGALGYALPYGSATAVHIFYGRIHNDHPADFVLVLGHAMAHEIGHVLQGIARHSDSGIMKPLWTSREYGEMRVGQLRFAAEDVHLIQLGMRDLFAGSLAARF